MTRIRQIEEKIASLSPPAPPATDFQGVLDSASATSAASRPASGAHSYPLAARGTLIGFPYQGTHTLYGNWESDNAVDIAAPAGTPVYAVEDGTIGKDIGALVSKDPNLEGLRLHLEAAGNEFYYAHLSRLVAQPGEHVSAGQLLGYSGSANGVAHLHFAAKTGDPRLALR